MKNKAGDISFRCKHNRFFFKFSSKSKRPPFYYQNFPDPEFPTALLSFARGKHINKCKYLIFENLNTISLWTRFLIIIAKNWKDRHFMVNGHRSLKLLRKDYIFIVTFNWYFIARTAIRNWHISAILICF